MYLLLFLFPLFSFIRMLISLETEPDCSQDQDCISVSKFASAEAAASMVVAFAELSEFSQAARQWYSRGCFPADSDNDPALGLLLLLVLKDGTNNHVGVCSFVCLFILGPPPWHMEFPGQGSNQSYSCQPIPQPHQWDLSCVCDLHHSSQQHWIPESLIEARGQTLSFMDTSRVHY